MLKKSLILLSILALTFSSEIILAQSIDGEMNVDGVVRKFHFVIPPATDKKLAAVIVLHGGGGSGSNMIRLTGFNDLAIEDTFIAVFPDGVNKGWNDGREADDLNRQADDIKFISKLIDYFISNKNVDSSKVFATGISNGAIFSLYLAYKLPNKIRAIAPVCGSIPVDYAANFSITPFTSVLVINGTADSLMKYNGGAIFEKKKERGTVIGTDSMINVLMKSYTCRTKMITESFPDVSIKDHSHAIKYIYPSCGFNSNIQLIKVVGGGHTWPGGIQYLPKFVIGSTCRDFNASAEIWKFFSEQK